MNQIKTFLYKTTCVIMIFFFGLIFLQTTVNLSHMPVIETFLTGIRKPMFLLSGAALLLLIFYILTKFLCRLTIRQRTAALSLMAVFGVSLQLLLIFGLRPCLQYDALKPVDTAIAMMKGIPLEATPYASYFAIYPHNLPLTLYIMLILKIAGLFGVSSQNSILVLQLVNCILFNLALVQLYQLLKRYFGIRKAAAFAVLCILNPLVYYYPVFFYTQSLSIPLFVLLITVFQKMLDEKSLKNRLFYGALYGIILFFAWKIRFLTLITLIACAMFLFFQKKNDRWTFKTAAALLLCITLTFSGTLIVNDLLMEKYSISADKEQAFPLHHWIMMGLKNDGSFDYMDEDFTSSLPNKEVRIEENTKIIRQRLQELGLRGLLSLWGKKLEITWSDGYDDYASNLTLIRHNNALTDFLCGWRSEYIASYLHMYHCMSWLLLLFCAIHLFKKGFADPGYTICITILGGIVFHLVWEAGEPYSMPFALLMIAGAAIGSDCLFRPGFESLFNKTAFRRGLLLLPALSLFWAAFLIPKLSKHSFPVTETIAIQNLLGGDYLYLQENDKLTQTFQASRTFNQITLRYKYYADTEGECVFTFRLYDSKGNCLDKQTLPLDSRIITTELSFADIVPNGTETYTIELTGEKVPDGSKVAVTAYHTGNWDIYQNGEARVNGSAVENTDINFEVTNRCRRTLF